MIFQSIAGINGILVMEYNIYHHITINNTGVFRDSSDLTIQKKHQENILHDHNHFSTTCSPFLHHCPTLFDSMVILGCQAAASPPSTARISALGWVLFHKHDEYMEVDGNIMGKSWKHGKHMGFSRLVSGGQ